MKLKTAVFGAALTFATIPAAAQTTVPTPTSQDRQIPGWVFTPSLGAGGGWDDNVLLANPGDDPPRDYASPVNPGVSLDFTGRRTRFSTGYAGSFTFYRTFDELSSHQHDVRTSFQYRLTPRMSVFADQGFSRAPTTDALQLAGVPFYRVGSRTNTLGGGMEAALSKYTSLRGRYMLRTVSFDFDEVAQQELRGGRAHEADISVTRALSARLSVGGEFSLLTGSLNQQLPIDQPQPGVDNDGEFTIYTGGGTATYRVTPHFNLTGGAGIARIAGTVAEEARIGPTVQLGASWQGEYVLASLSYQRSFIPSFGFGGTFQNEEWVGSIHVPFARNRAYADSSLSWFTNEPLEVTQPDLRWVWFSNKVGYRVTPWLSVEGYYTHARQNAQRAGSQLSRNQVGFQVVTSRPFRLQ